MPDRVRRRVCEWIGACGAAGALLLGALAAVSCGGQTPELPHVVMILADDVGYGDLPPYRRASGLAEPFALPHIERLAREGMLFLDAHQPAAICAPTRFAMLTGSNPSRGEPAWGMEAPSIFAAGGGGHRSVGTLMQAAGYRTAFVGKEHTGGPGLDADGEPTSDLSRMDPWARVETRVVRGDGTRQRRRLSRPRGLVFHGFDRTYSLAAGIQAPPYLYWRDDRFEPISPSTAPGTPLRHFLPYHVSRGPNGTNRISRGGPGDPDWDSSQVGIRLAGAARRIIASHVREHAGPLLLFYASQAIHTPHTPPVDFDGDPTPLDLPVRDTSLSRKSDMLVELDLQVGVILDALDAAGIAGNTLVFLTSDNGGHLGGPGDRAGKARERVLGFRSSGTLRGGKGTPWEGGHRVPFLARWGDGTPEGSRIAPGSRSSQLVAAPDWVATLYDLTGQPLPPDQAMDAVSLLPLLLSPAPDREAPVRDRLIFREYATEGAGGLGVRFDERDESGAPTHRWSYVERAADHPRLPARVHLFDLLADPAQRHDLLRGIRLDSDPRTLPVAAQLRHHAHWPRASALRDWARSHLGRGDPPSTPRRDYRREDARTPLPPRPQRREGDPVQAAERPASDTP